MVQLGSNVGKEHTRAEIIYWYFGYQNNWGDSTIDSNGLRYLDLLKFSYPVHSRIRIKGTSPFIVLNGDPLAFVIKSVQTWSIGVHKMASALGPLGMPTNRNRRGDTTPDDKVRILVVDDNRRIHEDFRRILMPQDSEYSNVHDITQGRLNSNELEKSLFGGAGSKTQTAKPLLRFRYEVDAVGQGKEGLEQVELAVSENRNYSLVFIDMRMPPGWNGAETAARIRASCPTLPIVICSAYSDFRWEEIVDHVGRSDDIHLLRKPFQVSQVRKLTDLLVSKSSRRKT